MKVTSIQTKLLILLLPAFILAMGLLSYSCYYLASRSLEKSMDDTARAIGADYANRIQDMVQDRVARLEDLASVIALQNTDGNAETVRLMAQTKQRLGTMFDVIFFISLDGSGIRFDGTTGRHNDRDYFKMVLETKQPYVSNPLISSTTGKLAINVSVPVIYNGQLVGVLGGSCSLEKLSEIAGSLKFMENGFGYLVDSAGVVIAHPQTELAGKLNLSESKIAGELKLSQKEMDRRLINLFKTAQMGKQARGEYTYLDGSSHIAVATPVELLSMHWVMMITVPMSEAEREITALTRTMLAVSLMFIIIAIIAILVISRFFTKPIRFIRDECLQLAQGDFRDRSAKVTNDDEIGQLDQGFRAMRQNIRQLVKKVQSQAEQVAASSEELTASAGQSAQASSQVASSIAEMMFGTEKQASAVVRITDVVERIAGSTQEIAVMMTETSEIARSAAYEAKQGKQDLEQVIGQMGQINQGSEAVQKAMEELNRGSHEIGKIVSLISTIAGQTNLLALNAAIEAARAGEHGRGFAVVAEEVRKLSEESNRAAGQIEALIKNNQANMQQAVKATEADSVGVKTGIRIASATGETFDNIVSIITKLSEQIEGSSNAVNGIAAGNRILVDASHELKMLSQENATEAETISSATQEQSAALEEIASASQSLANLAGDLHAAVSKFKV
ncbi:methyl-accepting chemotaxis protein [Sporomusaceae bacterium BoRhaA]|uniref:methyl-accepting chemotaxis protein n=1 Tax=Pelorhabdus rhamnosifermentans TaxID=2772457 RepID=UPI001C0628A7|nr:methyl-accepting chemotaxis protein [Pelorhabdus rhamnosifermentans]MBU2703989.1 methyl-accepting chemotaxis protein [Pelorhabdus rhamnosifermentans]